MISGVPGTPVQHAGTLLATVKARGLPQTAAVIVLAVGLAESGLRVLANGGSDGSQQLPNEGLGWDYDSVGIFQQRPGWGSLEQRMDPATSCGLFLDRLTAFDWRASSPWAAAQRVQVSAYDGAPRKANNWNAEYGGNYHAQYATALALCARLWGLGQSIHVTEEDDMPLAIVTETTHPTTGAKRYWVTTSHRFREVTKGQAAAVLSMTGGSLVTASEVAAAAGAPVLVSVLG